MRVLGISGSLRRDSYNTRLLTALRERTDELGQLVEELRALGEISQAVNSTLDLQTVLATIVAKAVQLSGGDTYYQASLGHAYARSGMAAEAGKRLHYLQELSAKRYVPPYAIALIYLGMGNTDHSLEWLERASADRSTSMAYLRVDPTLNSLRSEPRFAVLVRQTNF